MSGAQFSFFKPLASGEVRKRNWRQKGTLYEERGLNAETASRYVCVTGVSCLRSTWRATRLEDKSGTSTERRVYVSVTLPTGAC